jgi:transcriptional regulator with XRE-family HTH domain
MTLGEKITAARKRKKMSLVQLGQAIGMSPTNLSVIENDGLKNGPDPSTLIRIADTLDAPDVLLHHCEACLIRQHIMLRMFPDLNNIRRDPAIIVSRLRKEMIEAAEAAERLAERYSDANFRSREDYRETFEREMEQILDVKRGIEVLEFELILSGLHSQEDLDRVYQRQQAKCVAHGHHVENNGHTPLPAVAGPDAIRRAA